MTDTADTHTSHYLRAEVAKFKTVVRKLEAMPEGARGRALRWMMDKYRREIRECGLRGEP